MAKTTGPIIAIGAITIANRTVFNDKKMDWRIPLATGLAALLFAGVEQAWEEGAVMLAWTAVIAITLTRVEPDVPAPAESALKWWNAASK
jgi:hypothetical protein